MKLYHSTKKELKEYVKYLVQEFNAIGIGGASLQSSGMIAGSASSDEAWGAKKKKNKSSKKPLEEATAERDQDFRREAENVYNILHRIVSREQDIEYIQNNAQKNTQFKGYVLTPNFDKEWMEKYPDLLIILGGDVKIGNFDAERAITGGYTVINNGALHLVIISVLKGPYDLQYIQSRLSGAKKVLVHELIHYFDAKRRPNSPLKKSNKPEDYYNSPHEFNAYFQEGVSEIERSFIGLDRASKHNPEKAKKYIRNYISSFNDFEKNAQMKFEKDFIDHLNDKFRRKFKVRLYQTYEYFREKYSHYLEDPNMKKESLKQTVKEIVKEQIATIQEKGMVTALPPNMKVEVHKEAPGVIILMVVDEEGDEYGELQLAKSEEDGCLDAWEVIMASAHKGYGPFLYDIAMELVGRNGIMSDRQSTSNDARKVWSFYFNNRKDVVKKPVEYDCEAVQKTPMEELNYIYTKKNKNITDQLKKNNQLVFVKTKF